MAATKRKYIDVYDYDVTMQKVYSLASSLRKKLNEF